VNDAALVSGSEASANLAGDFDSFVGRESADAADDGGEVLSVDILHGEKRRAFGVADIEDAADVGMGDLASDTNFGMKSREGGGVLGEDLGKKLDSDKLAECQVFGAVDFAHAAAACHGNDAVAAGDHLSRSETAAAEGIRAG
jgi:hypothetical protein